MKYEWLKFPQVADVFDEAEKLARDDRSSVVSEWHLLLSLLRFDSVWDGFSAPEALRERLWEAAESASDGALASGTLPRWEPKFRNRILAKSERLRRSSGEALPMPTHFVSALFDCGSAELREVMEKFDFGKRGAENDGDEPSTCDDRHLPKNGAEALRRFTVELVAQAAKQKFGGISGRREETDSLMRTLSRSRKCCPVLVGRPGVGKTAAVEMLARRIAEGDVPACMRDAEIYSLNTGAIIAGASFYGQYESQEQAGVREAHGRRRWSVRVLRTVHLLSCYSHRYLFIIIW